MQSSASCNGRVRAEGWAIDLSVGGGSVGSRFERVRQREKGRRGDGKEEERICWSAEGRKIQ